MKVYRVSKQVLEQAERMAEKWTARAEAFWQDWQPGEGGYTSAGYCETSEDAEKCEERAERIREALAQISGSAYAPVAPWPAIEVLKAAAADRDVLDYALGV